MATIWNTAVSGLQRNPPRGGPHRAHVTRGKKNHSCEKRRSQEVSESVLLVRISFPVRRICGPAFPEAGFAISGCVFAFSRAIAPDQIAGMQLRAQQKMR